MAEVESFDSGLGAFPRLCALPHHGEITIYEAWALDGDRVKVRIEVRLPDRSYRALTRVVAFPLPPELQVSYRDWTIVVAPSWYGFGWRIFDESGAAAGESPEDVGEADYALERAQAHAKLREKLSDRPISSRTMYRLIQGYLCRLPGAMKKEDLGDGTAAEYCIYTPHSLRATTATLLLDAGEDLRKVQDLLGHKKCHHHADL